MKKASSILKSVLILALVVSSCKKGEGENFEVKIGNQTWMVKNLDVKEFRDGTKILHARTASEWETAGLNGTPAWCYYNNDSLNFSKYGILYNWHAVNSSKKLAPNGYRVPSDSDWQTLVDYLGGELIAGKKMKSASGWLNNGNGSNESEFTALPGGYRNVNGIFYHSGYYGYWWSSNEFDSSNAWYRDLDHTYNNIEKHNDCKCLGFSVRCIKD